MLRMIKTDESKLVIFVLDAKFISKRPFEISRGIQC